MRTVALAALFGLIIVAGVGCEYQMWSECRATNSWFYCARVLSK